MIEPSTQERAELPETSNNYICDLDNRIAELEAELKQAKANIANTITEIKKTPTYNGTVLHWCDLYSRLMKALKGGE